tara:strand:+ start:105 stop:329 length:225 start_codon:yes stop_codon:yes gene_type:complete
MKHSTEFNGNFVTPLLPRSLNDSLKIKPFATSNFHRRSQLLLQKESDAIKKNIAIKVRIDLIQKYFIKEYKNTA